MQSQARKLNRINSGLQNIAPHSTKILSRTEGASIGYAGYRKNRFALPSLGGLPKYIKTSFAKWWVKTIIRPKPITI